MHICAHRYLTLGEPVALRDSTWSLEVLRKELRTPANSHLSDSLAGGSLNPFTAFDDAGLANSLTAAS